MNWLQQLIDEHKNSAPDFSAYRLAQNAGLNSDGKPILISSTISSIITRDTPIDKIGLSTAYALAKGFNQDPGEWISENYKRFKRSD